jgi:hypothetical protein
MNAADSLTATLATIITETGCTFEAAFESYFTAMIVERPKTLRAFAERV